MMARNPILSPDRERQLLELVRRGDRGSLGELLGAYQKRVYHVCLRMVSNPDDAAELAQEVLLRAVQHIESFNGKSRFSTWLLRIAMNLSISHLRRKQLRNTASLDQGGGGGSSGGGGGEDQAAPLKAFIAEYREQSPAENVEKEEQVALLIESLDTLDASLKSVLVLRDLQGMDYQQIAEVLSVPMGTVKSRLFRARLALREAMTTRPIQKNEGKNA